MNDGFWTIAGLLLTNAGFLFGMWKYFDARISRVYERLDNVKCFVDSEFIKKEMCRVLHQNSADNFIGVEKRINDRFTQLEKKVDDSFGMILDLLKQK